MSILIVGSYQGIPEIPRVPCKQAVVDVKPDGAQVLNGKYRCCAGISFAKRMNLPETCHKPGDVCNDLLHVQSAIVEVTFLLDVIVERRTQVLIIQVAHCVAPQHPFLLADVIIPYLAGKPKDPLKDLPMQRHISVRVECQGTGAEDAGDVGSHPVGFLCLLFIGQAGRLVLIIGFQQNLHLLHINLSLDMLPCRLKQVVRGAQSIHRLQADGGLPVVGFLLRIRFPLTDVLIKIRWAVFVLFVHTFPLIPLIVRYFYFPGHYIADQTLLIFFQLLYL
ncbi:hypothetical protein EVA_06846 [gut metagenome]|uniref:Uncharacterized protein n=1 Tax=gut metagenome TaxID=749906 RepID=J9GCK3_9ZZZZ